MIGVIGYVVVVRVDDEGRTRDGRLRGCCDQRRKCRDSVWIPYVDWFIVDLFVNWSGSRRDWWWWIDGYRRWWCFAEEEKA